MTELFGTVQKRRFTVAGTFDLSRKAGNNGLLLGALG